MTHFRREFSVAAQIAIIARACDDRGVIHCETCAKPCWKRKDYEIDHVIPEGMRPTADKMRALTAADGQLLCKDCHDKKTVKDKGEIGLAKRQEAYHLGVEKPGKHKMRTAPKERTPYQPAAGKNQIARRFGQ